MFRTPLASIRDYADNRVRAAVARERELAANDIDGLEEVPGERFVDKRGTIRPTVRPIDVASA
jgi:hypothetical protein